MPARPDRRIDASHLADLRRLRRRLLFGGGALLTLLIITATVFSGVTRVRDFHASERGAFMEGKAAVDYFLVQRDRAYAMSINGNDAMWVGRHSLLQAAGQPLLAPFHEAGDSLMVTGTGRIAVPWLVLGLPGRALPDTELAAHLGMIQEYSAFSTSTITWQSNKGAGDVMYAYEPQGRLLAVAGVKNEADLLQRLGVQTREQAFARLLDEETVARTVKPQAAPVLSAVQGGRLISRFGLNPMTGQPSLVGILTLAEGTTPYFRRVVFEPVDSIRQRLAARQSGDFLLVTRNEQVVFSSGGLSVETLAGLRRWGSALQGEDVTEAHLLDHFLLAAPIQGTDWHLVHAYDWSDVWQAKGYALTWHALAALGIIGLLWWVLLRMDRRLFAPALVDAGRVLESQMLSRTIIETSPVGLALIAVSDGKPLLQNALAQQLARPETSALDEGIPTLYAELAQRASGEPGEGPYVLAWPEQPQPGQRRLQVRLARASFHDQAVWVCSLHDVTSQVELEGHLRLARHESERAREMAEAASRAKTAFVAHMSHEIRTPLNGVLGHLELLGRSSLQPAQHERLQRIRLSADALMDIISDVLDFSKIEAGQLDVEPEPFALRPMIEQAALLYAPAAARKGLKLYFQIHAPAGQEYMAGAHRLRQILNNLLSNAVKFTESGRVLIRATVEDGADGVTRLQIEIVDSGIGMAPEQVQQLFQPFQQADASIARRFGGSGLGLALCQQLAQVLGGSISAQSTQGVGSVFTLQVPVQKSALASTQAHPLMGQRITVLSASAEWREELPRLLQEWGAETDVLERPAAFNADAPATMMLVVGERRAWDEADEIALRAAHTHCVRAYGSGPLVPEVREGDLHVSCYSSAALLTALAAPLEAGPAAAPAPATPPPDVAPATSVGQGRVLLVEDNPVNRELIQQQLEELGYQVEAAENGQVALTMWQDGRYRAVLTDINMPLMDGYTFATALRRRGTSLPILAVTATALASERQRCREAGIDDLLLKPLDLRRLQAGLRRHVGSVGTALATPPRKVISERLRRIFVDSASGDIAVLQRALREGDREALLDRVHALKGALMMMGERVLGERCGEMEQDLRTGGACRSDALADLIHDLQVLVASYQPASASGDGHA